MLSKKAQLLKPSPTLALSAKAKELEAAGKPVINLTVGEPDWPSFEVAKKSAKEAIDRNETKYTIATGIPQLRKAIIDWTKKQTGIQYGLNEIAVTSGAKFALYSLFQMTIDAGDEVIIPSPYWVSYPAMVELAGGESQILKTDLSTDFKITADSLKKAITKKTKMLILCSPSNPTGATYTEAELRALADVLRAHPQLIIVLDDIYNSLYFADQDFSPHLLAVSPELKSRTFTVNGASKSFAMTGWRIGWILGPEPVIKAVANHISQSTSNPSSISQWATLAALEQGAAELQRSKEMLWERRNYCVEKFSKLKYLKLFAPQGAFYLWFDISSCLGKISNGRRIDGSATVSSLLLDQYFIATVPGVEFGTEAYIRMSFAASKESLEEAFQRLVLFEDSLES